MRLPTSLLRSEFVMKQVSVPKPSEKPAEPRPELIAIRKTCDATGTGLSHYVLMDKPAKP
jgi:modified peptide precursor CbpA